MIKRFDFILGIFNITMSILFLILGICWIAIMLYLRNNLWNVGILIITLSFLKSSEAYDCFTTKEKKK